MNVANKRRTAREEIAMGMLKLDAVIHWSCYLVDVEKKGRYMIRRASWIGALSFLLFVCSNSLHAVEKIRVGSGGFTPLHSMIWAADRQGIFKKYGFDVEYLALNSGTLGVQTLLAKETQFLFSTGALAITANLQGGDITMVTGGFNMFAFKFIARPEIKNAEELRGKRVSISQFGSATDFAVQASLEKLGVDPRQVTVIQLGGNPNRLSALTGGSTEATLFSEPFATLAIKKYRMNLLLDMAKAGIAFPQSALMVKRSYLDMNREKVTSFVKALIEGLYLVKRDKALAIQVMKKYIHADDEVTASATTIFCPSMATTCSVCRIERDSNSSSLKW
jgi:NitT/TauT family transport system substrate-binding protein